MKRCYFDDGEGCCHASEDDECPCRDENIYCECFEDIHGNPLLPDESGTPFWN